MEQQRHEFGLVDIVGRHLTEVNVLRHHLFRYLSDVGYLRDRRYSIASQMRIDDNRLRIGVADDAYSRVTAEVFEFILELTAEVITFQTVNATAKSAFLIIQYHAGTLCSEM